MERGYIKLYRKSIDSQVFQREELWRLWTLCLLNASHKEIWVPIQGIINPVKVLPGQFITGRFSLHRDYYPRKGKKHKSPLTVWRWLRILEKMGNLNIEMNNRYSIITIINWLGYQPGEIRNEQQNEQQMNKRPTDEQKMNNKQAKNEQQTSKKRTTNKQQIFYNNYNKLAGLPTRGNPERTTNEQQTSKKRTTNKQKVNTNKKEKIKNVLYSKNDKSKDKRSINTNTSIMSDSYRTRKGKFLKGDQLKMFLKFWDAFGDKRGMAEASDVWLRLQIDNGLFEKIIAGAKRYNIERKAILAKDRIPKMPQGWLSARRWEDEILQVTDLQEGDKGKAVSRQLFAWLQLHKGQVQAYGDYLHIDTSAMEADPIRDKALKICPPPNITRDLRFWPGKFEEVYNQILSEEE